MIAAFFVAMMVFYMTRADSLQAKLLLQDRTISQLARESDTLKWEVRRLKDKVKGLETEVARLAVLSGEGTNQSTVDGAAAATVAVATPNLEIAAITAVPQRIDRLAITGRVTEIEHPERYRIVVYAYTDAWYVQPATAQPFTQISQTGGWSTYTHPGSEFAALVVEESYGPPFALEALPVTGNGVLAIARKKAK